MVRPALLALACAVIGLGACQKKASPVPEARRPTDAVRVVEVASVGNCEIYRVESGDDRFFVAASNTAGGCALLRAWRGPE